MNLTRGRRIAVFVLLSVLLAGCGQRGDTQDAAAQPEYVVGSDASYPPFESMVGANQAIEGFDVDLLRIVAAHAGFRVRFVNTPWEGIFDELRQGRRDILASAISINAERARNVDFSDPYFDARQVIAVPHGAGGIGSFADLAGERVAVQVGTSADVDLQQLVGKTSQNIVRFQTMTEAFDALKAGKVKALVGDNGVVAGFVRHSKGMFFTVEDTASFAPEHYGFAVKKGRAGLREKINAGLAAARADGSYAALYQKYFGTGQ
ncbi:basic amino acid ABC transporter substrate-binding protein [Paludibacterium purpuratum]|uniref:Polar amino acid transport system substrate-binding protein n=1 Tax=Paludibacterium purpuratum TaxID=1144873 RepID=A0A4R7AW80_9NEIS|nr:basic amino acid ABC transporter substrate-binding protein [Paludibacterium purpuratum]TDR71643.1 polar amino acid transport system substrate-binding protein [Paludibacterium purpuratum]